MKTGKWGSDGELLRLFKAVGRASLLYDIQDSHSGNMAVRWKDARGEERIVITSTGSQKGDLEADDICYLSAAGTDFGYYKASSETDIHAKILSLPEAGASMHAHVKELIMVTLDQAPKPGPLPDFRPVDALARHFLGTSLPVDCFSVPSGSAEMTKIVPERLTGHPLTIVYGHGALAKGRTLQEAFFRLCLANNAGAVIRAMWRLGVDTESLRENIKSRPALQFPWIPPDYDIAADERCDFEDEDEIRSEFIKAGNRIFESRLSPFHTGTMSVRGVDDMLYAPKASMPRDLGGPLIRIPLAESNSDPAELGLHKEIYRESDFQTVIHCHVPEAEAAAHYVYPGENAPADRIIPVDAEGSFLYLAVPVLPPDFQTGDLLRLLHDYKIVVVRGGGVWSVGSQSLSEVLHHPSSLREICLYRIAAVERSLDLRGMEPEKARRW